MATKTAPSVTLFTPVEHAVLAKWFNVNPPPEAAGLDPDTALAQLLAEMFHTDYERRHFIEGTKKQDLPGYHLRQAAAGLTRPET